MERLSESFHTNRLGRVNTLNFVTLIGLMEAFYGLDEARRLASAQEISGNPAGIILALFRGLSEPREIRAACADALIRIWPEMEPALDDLEWFGKQSLLDNDSTVQARLLQVVQHFASRLGIDAKEALQAADS